MTRFDIKVKYTASNYIGFKQIHKRIKNGVLQQIIK